ncbi:MAG: VOC family protein [Pseudomonadota bacterium]
MRPTPYRFCDGDCADAIAFYQERLGAEARERLPASATPPGEMTAPEAKNDWVMRRRLSLGEGEIMMSDNLVETGDAMAGCSVSLIYRTEAEARAVFGAR